jgi:hypothetical protein
MDPDPYSEYESGPDHSNEYGSLTDPQLCLDPYPGRVHRPKRIRIHKTGGLNTFNFAIKISGTVPQNGLRVGGPAWGCIL